MENTEPKPIDLSKVPKYELENIITGASMKQSRYGDYIDKSELIEILCEQGYTVIE